MTDPRSQLVVNPEGAASRKRGGRSEGILPFTQVASRAKSGAIYTRSDFLRQAAAALLSAKKAAVQGRG